MVRLKKGMAWVLSALCIFTMSQVPGMTAQAGPPIVVTIGSGTGQYIISHVDVSETSEHSDYISCSGYGGYADVTREENQLTFTPTNATTSDGVVVSVTCTECDWSDSFNLIVNPASTTPDAPDPHDTIAVGQSKTYDFSNTHKGEALNRDDLGRLSEYCRCIWNPNNGILTLTGLKETNGVKKYTINCESCSPITINIEVTAASSTPSSASTATTTTPEHTHNFSWVTVQEVTTAQDGIEEYRCDCGMVDERSIIPSSQVYVKGLYGAIKNAPENGEVTYDTGKISTISDYIIKKLQERNDVKTVITFEYKNAKYKMSIPAGVDYTKLLEDQDYFYGYFFFANEVGAAIESL